MEPLILTGLTLSNALGLGIDATARSLVESKSGLIPCDFDHAEIDTYIGKVKGLEDSPVVESLMEFDCRNNRLAQLTLQQDNFKNIVEDAKKRFGPDRIGLFLGTSTSGILETELAYINRDPETGNLPSSYRYLQTHDNFATTDFSRRYLGLEGPALTISTACSSSAKVFANAYRFIQSGFCDAAVVGGVDSLCLTTLYGFSSMELVSSQPCRPADKDRDGISIGEAGGFVLLEKQSKKKSLNNIALLGYGESCDAYHMGTPHPEGHGMAQAIYSALDKAELEARDISYVNLHGTATQTNDKAEDLAIASVFGSNISVSSTKGWTGHTLGSSGITEAIISCICLNNNFIPGSLNTNVTDPDLKVAPILENRNQEVNSVISNSFGFGGNNCSLIFGKLS
jgi:3-oxoacyl-[acyl-carrier-protein] synthase-1